MLEYFTSVSISPDARIVVADPGRLGVRFMAIDDTTRSYHWPFPIKGGSWVKRQLKTQSADLQEIRIQCKRRRQIFAVRVKNRLERWFGSNVVLIYGDWNDTHGSEFYSVPVTSLAQALKEAGMLVYLINEHNTSKTCPICLKKTVHRFEGQNRILHCMSQECGSRIEGRPVTYQRDHLACLNMCYIVKTFITQGFIPDGFEQ